MEDFKIKIMRISTIDVVVARFCQLNTVWYKAQESTYSVNNQHLTALYATKTETGMYKSLIWEDGMFKLSNQIFLPLILIINFEVIPKGKSIDIMPRTDVDLSVTKVATFTPVLWRKFRRDFRAKTSIDALLPTWPLQATIKATIFFDRNACMT